MRGIWWLLILLLGLMGCAEDEGAITFQDDTKVTSWLDDLTLRLHIENHTNEPMMAEFEVDIHNEWLANQINGEPTIYEGYPGSDEVAKDFVEIDHQAESFYSVSYQLKSTIDKQQFITAIDQGAVEVKLHSESGKLLANDTIDNLYIYDLDRIRNGNQLFIFIFIVTVIGIVLIDKFVRYWTGIPKVEREELPKPYKIMTNVLSVGVTIFTTFFMQSISLGGFWKVLALFVLFYFLAQIILQFIYLRSAKEYRVSLINLVIILLTITVLSYQFPYPLH